MRTYLQLLILAFLLGLLCGTCRLCTAQLPPPVPSFAQPQLSSNSLQLPPQQPAWLVPVPARFPYIRYRVLGMGPRVEVMVPVGQPFSATVTPVAPVGVAR